MKKRQANFELLRIAAMYMVVVMHYLNDHVGSLFFDLGLNSLSVTAVVLDSVCIVAVDAFVLLGGYFLSVRPFSLRRLIRLLFQVLFYTLSIPPVLALFGVLPFSEVWNVYHIWNSLFPVQSGHYWFISSYVAMLLLSPFLNAALEKMDKRQMQIGLLLLLLLFCIGKSFSPLQFATDRYGYDPGWFLVLYLTGGYLHRFGIPFFQSSARGFGVYLASAGLIAVLELSLIWLGGRFSWLRYYTSVPFHYNFLLCFTGALGLFYGFARLPLQEGRLSDFVRFVSPAALGVYLIHGQSDIALRWCSWIDALTAPVGLDSKAVSAAAEGPEKVLWFLAVLFVQVTIVFVLCAALDKLRGALFAWAERKLAKK